MSASLEPERAWRRPKIAGEQQPEGRAASRKASPIGKTMVAICFCAFIRLKPGRGMDRMRSFYVHTPEVNLSSREQWRILDGFQSGSDDQVLMSDIENATRIPAKSVPTNKQIFCKRSNWHAPATCGTRCSAGRIRYAGQATDPGGLFRCFTNNPAATEVQHGTRVARLSTIPVGGTECRAGIAIAIVDRPIAPVTQPTAALQISVRRLLQLKIAPCSHHATDSRAQHNVRRQRDAEGNCIGSGEQLLGRQRY